jgi:hypothetical protein
MLNEQPTRTTQEAMIVDRGQEKRRANSAGIDGIVAG